MLESQHATESSSRFCGQIVSSSRLSQWICCIDITYTGCFSKTNAAVLGCSDRAVWRIRGVHRAVPGLYAVQIARLQKTWCL